MRSVRQSARTDRRSAGPVLFTLAVYGFLPAGPKAQTPLPPDESNTLSAAMAEALQSPFHASSGNGPPFAFGVIGRQSSAFAQETSDTSVADRRSSGSRVFLPTLAAAFLADAAAFVAVASAGYGGSDGLAILALTGAVAVPALTAGSLSGHFKESVLGSPIGAGGAFLIVAMDPDNALTLGLAPTVHAIFTAAFARSARGRNPHGI